MVTTKTIPTAVRTIRLIVTARIQQSSGCTTSRTSSYENAKFVFLFYFTVFLSANVNAVPAATNSLLINSQVNNNNPLIISSSSNSNLNINNNNNDNTNINNNPNNANSLNSNTQLSAGLTNLINSNAQAANTNPNSNNNNINNNNGGIINNINANIPATNSHINSNLNINNINNNNMINSNTNNNNMNLTSNNNMAGNVGSMNGDLLAIVNATNMGVSSTGSSGSSLGNIVALPKEKLYDKCTGPSDPGPCKQFTYKWRYESTTNECTSFIWGGCEGNTQNRFNSEAECLFYCIGAPRK